MDLDQVVRARRMCRDFSTTPVAAEVLDRALNLALQAPSAGNTQGLAFVVLEGDRTGTFWEHQASDEWRARPSLPGLMKAPVVIVPLANRDRYVERYSEPDKGPAGLGTVGSWQVPYWLVDTAFATMLLLLGLEQEGLGALFFALRYPSGPLLGALGVPGGWQPLGAVATGWPSGQDRPATSSRRPRRGWAEVVHRGGWSGQDG